MQRTETTPYSQRPPETTRRSVSHFSAGSFDATGSPSPPARLEDHPCRVTTSPAARGRPTTRTSHVDRTGLIFGSCADQRSEDARVVSADDDGIGIHAGGRCPAASH